LRVDDDRTEPNGRAPPPDQRPHPGRRAPAQHGCPFTTRRWTSLTNILLFVTVRSAHSWSGRGGGKSPCPRSSPWRRSSRRHIKHVRTAPTGRTARQRSRCCDQLSGPHVDAASSRQRQQSAAAASRCPHATLVEVPHDHGSARSPSPPELPGRNIEQVGAVPPRRHPGQP